MKRYPLAAAAAALLAASSHAMAGYVYELELTGTSPTSWDRPAAPANLIADDPVVITIDDSGIFQVSRLSDVDTLHYAEGISLALYLGTGFEPGDGTLASTWDREIELADAASDLYAPSEEAFEEIPSLPPPPP